MTTEAKELIELCARALGYKISSHCIDGSLMVHQSNKRGVKKFNPFTSDSDSSLLRRTLEIGIIDTRPMVASTLHGIPAISVVESHNETVESKATAERLAVAKCAAEWQRRREEV